MSLTFILLAEDARRAGRFYREALGARITWSDSLLTVVDLHGHELRLHGARCAGVDTGLAVEVDDLERACVVIECAGGSVARPPGAPWLAVATDTEGNRFTIVRRGGLALHPAVLVSPPEAGRTRRR